MNKDLINAIVKELLGHAIKRLSFLIIMLMAPMVWAKDFTKSFGDWTYHAYGGQYDRHCLIYTESGRVRGEFDEERETPYLYIIKRGHREFTLGVSPGYELDDNKAIILKVRNRAYALKTGLPHYGWTFSSTQDVGLIDEMLKANRFVTVHAYGESGSVALDYYSLKGFVHALKQLDKCQAKRYYKP